MGSGLIEELIIGLLTNVFVGVVFFLLGLWFSGRQVRELKNYIKELLPYATHLRDAVNRLDGKTIEGEGRIAIDRDSNGNPTKFRILRSQEIVVSGIPSEEEVPESTIEIGLPPSPTRYLSNIPVVTKTAEPNPAYAGSPLTFHITLTNEGNTTIADATISDILLPNMDLVATTAISASGNDVSEGCFRDAPTPTTPDGAVGCRVGDIPSGDSATMDIVVIPREAGTYRNHAGSSFSSPPGVMVDPSRNLTSIDIRVLPTPYPPKPTPKE